MSGENQEKMLNQLNEANNKGGAACFAAYLRGAQKIYVNGQNLETRQEMAYVSFGQIESGLRKG